MSYAAHFRTLLQPLGVYRLDSESLSGAELDALGEAFDALYNEMETALREALPLTAEGEGLAAYETLQRYPRLGLTTQQRRDAILGLLRMPACGAGVSSLVDAARFVGGEIATDSENLPQSVTVSLPQSIPAAQRESVERYLAALLPCHLEADFAYE